MGAADGIPDHYPDGTAVIAYIRVHDLQQFFEYVTLLYRKGRFVKPRGTKAVSPLCHHIAKL
jgi:hypothetical protein